MIGTSGPIDADGNRPQKAKRASSMGIGRGRTICEYIEIMQILPGSSDYALLINPSRAVCNTTTANGARSELEVQEFEPLPHAEQRDRERKCRD